MSVIAALLLAASPCAAAPGDAAVPAHVSYTQAGSGHGAQGARHSRMPSSARPCASRFDSRTHYEARERHRTVQHSTVQHRTHDAAARSGDPVRLGPAFFQTGDSGGVGRDPAVYTVSRRLILIGPGHPPLSAGREAARRGLGHE
jgi:hypothetical protein